MAQKCDLYFCYKLYVRRMVQSCKMFFFVGGTVLDAVGG